MHLNIKGKLLFHNFKMIDLVIGLTLSPLDAYQG